MSYGSSPVEDQRPFVDNASRPGKGSRPRPYSISRDEVVKRMAAIFKWGKQRTRRAKGGRK